MRKDWSHDVVELSDDPVVHWVEAALLVWRAHDERAISSVEVGLKMSSGSTSRGRMVGGGASALAARMASFFSLKKAVNCSAV